MDKVKINSLRAEMRKITDALGFKLNFSCECNYRGQVDYFEYYENPFITCPKCERKPSLERPITPPFEFLPLYKVKFIDAHLKVIQQLTINGVNFSQGITDEQECFFDYNWDFAMGVIDIHTSCEMFIYQLLSKALEKIVKTMRKINENNPKFQEKDNEPILSLIEKINSHEIFEANMVFEGLTKPFTIQHCIILLKEIEAIDKNILTSTYYPIGRLRNRIVHSGDKANFDDYANTFIAVGKIVTTYNQ